MDYDSAWSNTATVSIAVDSGVAPDIPHNGLVLHLEADRGVFTSGGAVTGWNDQSGQGNHLTGSGNPVAVAAAPSGAMVMDLDGSNDKFERAGSVMGLPAGNGDRTVYLVAEYGGTGIGGFAYGDSRCNRTFGAVVATDGDLMVQGWCSANDFNSGVAGTGAGWLVQSVVLASGQLRHFVDGSLIDSRAHSFNTVVNRLVLGAEIDGSPAVDMRVAAVLVWNRALSAAEQAKVLAYLQEKYLVSKPDPPPGC